MGGGCPGAPGGGEVVQKPGGFQGMKKGRGFAVCSVAVRASGSGLRTPGCPPQMQGGAGRPSQGDAACPLPLCAGPGAVPGCQAGSHGLACRREGHRWRRLSPLILAPGAMGWDGGCWSSGLWGAANPNPPWLWDHPWAAAAWAEVSAARGMRVSGLPLAFAGASGAAGR